MTEPHPEHVDRLVRIECDRCLIDGGYQFILQAQADYCESCGQINGVRPATVCLDGERSCIGCSETYDGDEWPAGCPYCMIRSTIRNL